MPKRQAVQLVREIPYSPIRVIDPANGYSDGKAKHASARPSARKAEFPMDSSWSPKSMPETEATRDGEFTIRSTKAATA